MFLLVLFLITGGIGALIAGSKGRSQWGWFLLCFFFSFLAIIILLCLPSIKREDFDITKKCPKCAERVLEEAVVCKHCSFEFEEDDEKEEYVNDSLRI